MYLYVFIYFFYLFFFIFILFNGILFWEYFLLATIVLNHRRINIILLSLIFSIEVPIQEITYVITYLSYLYLPIYLYIFHDLPEVFGVKYYSHLLFK